MKEAKFWMVWNPDGHAPVYKHESMDLAVCEAERLARLNSNTSFYVLESIEGRRVETLQRIEMVDQIPF